MMMALLELWQTHYLKTETHLVLPYAQKLAHLPDFLQQLTMESNGKRVSPAGEVLEHHTAPVLWGSAGTIGQHSYYQLLQTIRPVSELLGIRQYQMGVSFEVVGLPQFE